MESRRSYCSKSCRDLGIDTVHILQSCPKMGKSELSSGPALFISVRYSSFFLAQNQNTMYNYFVNCEIIRKGGCSYGNNES